MIKFFYYTFIFYRDTEKMVFRGRSSGVERNLAKVEVEGSNPFARSKFLLHLYFSKSSLIYFQYSFIYF